VQRDFSRIEKVTYLLGQSDFLHNWHAACLELVEVQGRCEADMHGSNDGPFSNAAVEPPEISAGLIAAFS
jgi:hypothetical protein